jgi:hypothetical protein
LFVLPLQLLPTLFILGRSFQRLLLGLLQLSLCCINGSFQVSDAGIPLKLTMVSNALLPELVNEENQDSKDSDLELRRRVTSHPPFAIDDWRSSVRFY